MSTDPPFRWLDEGDGCFIQKTDDGAVVYRPGRDVPAWAAHMVCDAMNVAYRIGREDFAREVRRRLIGLVVIPS